MVNLMNRTRKRLLPHRGMAVDEVTWTLAHDYHHHNQALHSLHLHSVGIVWGLDVTASNIPGQNVVVHPGVAVNQDGSCIVVPEPQLLTVSLADSGTVYVLIQFREIEDGDIHVIGNQSRQPLYVTEGFRVMATTTLPDEPHLELARIECGGTEGSITNPLDYRLPGRDQIDTRFRRNVHGQPGVVKAGLLTHGSGDGSASHESGLIDLIAYIRTCRNYGAEFAGYVTAGNLPDDLNLIVLTDLDSDVKMETDELSGLKEFLDKGGVLFGDPCSDDSGEHHDPGLFMTSFEALASQLSRTMAEVDPGHSILSKTHKFLRPPNGRAGDSLLIEGDGMIFNDSDYGCLWSGECGSDSIERESLRSATEIGLNIAEYAISRTANHELLNNLAGI